MFVALTGELFASGCNLSGQLGLGSHMPRCTEPKAVEAFRGVVVTGVACGLEHTCCSTEGGNAYTWGCHENGRLGHGSGWDAEEGFEFAPRSPHSPWMYTWIHIHIETVCQVTFGFWTLQPSILSTQAGPALRTRIRLLGGEFLFRTKIKRRSNEDAKK